MNLVNIRGVLRQPGSRYGDVPSVHSNFKAIIQGFKGLLVPKYKK